MKEYKKNMTDKDVLFENRKASLFPPQTVVEDAEETTEITEVAEVAEATNEVVSADAVDATDAAEGIEMSEVKSSIEQVDAWSSQKLGIQ
jgi:hypothetical protein